MTNTKAETSAQAYSIADDGTNDISRHGIYLMMDEIKSESVRPCIEWIIKNNIYVDPFEKLSLMINSPGGSVSDAFALIDVIKGSKIPIETIGIGEVSSSGLMIFMAGQKGYRRLTPNTQILSHQYSWGNYGKEHELFSQVKAYELTSKMIVDHYKKCTGLNEKKIREFLLPPEDRWLSAKEALKLGLCDEVKELY
jgi:ATP-dependent Clp protease protease subunit